MHCAKVAESSNILIFGNDCRQLEGVVKEDHWDKELNILKFHDICKLQMGQFLFSWKNSSLTNYFNYMFTLNAQMPGLKRKNVENF